MRLFGYLDGNEIRFVTSEFHLRPLWSNAFFDDGKSMFIQNLEGITLWTTQASRDRNYLTLRSYFRNYQINVVIIGQDGIDDLEPKDFVVVENIIPARSADTFGIIRKDGQLIAGVRGQDYVDVAKKADFESVNDCIAKGNSLFSIFRNNYYVQTLLNGDFGPVKRWLSLQPNNSNVAFDFADKTGNTKVMKNFKSIPETLSFLNSIKIWGNA